MLAIERRAEIIRLIKRDKSVRVNELSEKFQVTEETIRRDLDKLDKEGKVKKTYGGAVLEDYVSEDPSFNDRMKVNMDQKKIMASYANQLIQDGETIFIDMSTTALEMIKNVDNDKKITVITNSLNALVELSQRTNIKLIAIGGTFNTTNLSMEGPMTSQYIDQYYADKTLFSVKGITTERGIMDSKEESANIKRHMVNNAKQAILVADDSKFNQSALIKVIEIEKVDMVITNYKMDQQWREFFEQKDIEVQVVEQK